MWGILGGDLTDSGAFPRVFDRLRGQAAIKAVKQWRYHPLVLNGQAVPFILVVTVSFSLR